MFPNIMTTKQYIIYITLCVTPYLITTAVKKFLEYRIKKLESSDFGKIDSIMITPHYESCWRHMMSRKQCSKNCSYAHLKTILKHLENAKFEILLCVNHLTVNDIALALIAAKERGVDVRCLTDYQMLKVMGSKIPLLHSNGIPVKTQVKRNFNLHHKFFVIDGEQDNKMVFFGSLNLTVQGFTKNFEQLIITSNSKIVHSFRAEFEYLWTVVTGYYGD